MHKNNNDHTLLFVFFFLSIFKQNFYSQNYNKKIMMSAALNIIKIC